MLLALAAASQPAWLLAAGGNLGGFLLATVATSAALLLSGRSSAAGAVAGLPVVKPHPLLVAIPLLLLTLPRAVAVRVIASALATGGALVVASLLVRPGWASELVAQMPRMTGYATRQATVFGLVGAAAYAWGVVVALAVAFVVWARRARPPMSLLAAAAVPVSLFAAPYGWSYDQLLLAVTAAAVVGLVARAGRAWRAVMLVLPAAALVMVPWTLYALAFRRGEESWSAVVPLTVLGVMAMATLRAGRSAAAGRVR